MIEDPQDAPETDADSSLAVPESRNSAGNKRGMSSGSQANLRRGGDEATPEKPDSKPDGGICQQLRDMQHAYARPASEDRTHGQRTCRKWMKADLSKFMSSKNRLEEKFPNVDEDGNEIVRLRLDSRRDDPSFDQDDAVSLVIGVGDGDEAFELLFSTEEFLRYRSGAAEDGLPLWEWIRSSMNGS